MDELPAVQPAVAVAHEFDGDGVDAGVARLLARRERGQFAVVASRKVLTDVPDLRRHQVEVVEQPFRRGCDELSSPHIVGQGSIGLAQDAGVVIEPGKDAPCTTPRVRVDGEAGGERLRSLFQSLDAEQLVAQRFFRWRRAAAPEPTQEPFHPCKRSYNISRVHHQVVDVIGEGNWRRATSSR
jgi:hypothetical protein